MLFPKILNLVKEMYEGFRCKVFHEGKLTETFVINTGVRRGCFLFPNAFLLVLGRIMRKTLGGMEKRNAVQRERQA
jgi:hypothetical protein